MSTTKWEYHLIFEIPNNRFINIDITDICVVKFRLIIGMKTSEKYGGIISSQDP